MLSPTAVPWIVRMSSSASILCSTRVNCGAPLYGRNKEGAPWALPAHLPVLWLSSARRRCLLASPGRTPRNSSRATASPVPGGPPGVHLVVVQRVVASWQGPFSVQLHRGGDLHIKISERQRSWEPELLPWCAYPADDRRCLPTGRRSQHWGPSTNRARHAACTSDAVRRL